MEKEVTDKEAVIHRMTQYNLLSSIFGPPSAPTVPCVLLLGASSTGKTLTVSTLLERGRCPHVIVDCVETTSAQGLFELVLHSLAGRHPGPHSNYRPIYRCPSLLRFLSLLREVITAAGSASQTTYLVFKHAERLRTLDSRILASILRLQQLTRLNICCVLLTSVDANSLATLPSGTEPLQPLTVQFPNYTRDEILDILCEDCPLKYKNRPNFYRAYATLIVSVFMSATRCLSELKFLAAVNFSKYVEPVESGEVSADAESTLCKLMTPYLKAALQTVFLREVSVSEWETVKATDSKVEMQPLRQDTVELPRLSKYLLVAAYLASYNPAKCDRRFFSQNAGRLRKQKTLKKTERTSGHILGPKPFPLDRLRAIFNSILEDAYRPPSSTICSQISTLVSLRLLGQVGQVQLTSPKYRCLASFELARAIGRSINIDVTKCLFDFV